VRVEIIAIDRAHQRVHLRGARVRVALREVVLEQRALAGVEDATVGVAAVPAGAGMGR
jgi:hypothetical protein